MRKEAAHGKLANRESAIECTRKPHATRSAARQEASPQIVRRSIRIATVPQTAKHATGIVAGPQAHHRFRRARQAANRRHASEAKTTRYHGASRGPTPWWWFPLCTRTIKRCRYPACTARISSSKRAAWMQRDSKNRFPSSSKGSSTRAALFRNDTHSTTFSRRTVRSKRVKTAASKSSSRSGKNANVPRPKSEQKGCSKKPWRLFKGIDQLAKSGCANQSATKAKMRDHQCYDYGKFSASRRATRASKPWDLLNARSV